MSYLLNLSLPLWWMFLPLIIAGLLAAKLYQWQRIFSKMKSNYQSQLREAQNRLDEALNAEGNNLTRQANKYESEIAQLKLAIRQADDNLNDVRLTWAGKSEKDAEIIRGLNAQAVERELLIKTLRADIANENEILSSRIADKNTAISELNNQIAQLTNTINFKDSVIQADEATMKGLRSEIGRLEAKVKDLNLEVDKEFETGIKYAEKLNMRRIQVMELESKLELSELAHNETNHDYQTLRGRVSVLTLLNEDLKADLNAAIAVINRTGRGRKQWAKIQAAKKAERNAKTVTIINDGRIEGVVHDSIGVSHSTENQKAGIVPESVKFVTVYKADQSENDNGRHDVLSICNEVNRGIAEQAEAIKKELQADGVDISTLEVGDSVVLRNDLKYVISQVLRPLCGYDFAFKFEEGNCICFMSDGRYEIDKVICDFDIIQIIKKSKNK